LILKIPHKLLPLLIRGIAQVMLVFYVFSHKGFLISFLDLLSNSEFLADMQVDFLVWTFGEIPFMEKIYKFAWLYTCSPNTTICQDRLSKALIKQNKFKKSIALSSSVPGLKMPTRGAGFSDAKRLSV
jgi:hypothetical protein